jgi:hypothetical protein
MMFEFGHPDHRASGSVGRAGELRSCRPLLRSGRAGNESGRRIAAGRLLHAQQASR